MADSLWRECALWLVGCSVLPPDHRVTWPQAQVLDLANTLRDGVLLCQLVNTLSPGSVDMREVSLRPQMSQFLCLKNIRTFLQTCQAAFDLKESDLFEPYMLFDYTDFGQVLNTLSMLSHSSKGATNGTKGFPASLELAKACEYYNDDVYRNLEELAIANGESHEASEETMVAFDFPVVHGSSSRRTYEEDIYEDLCYVTLRVGPGSSAEPQSSAYPAVPAEKRDYCIKELVETEKNYIEALNMIVRHFLRPLKSVLRQSDRKIIFLHVKELAEIHTGFHSELFKACSSSQYKISTCFLHWKEKLVVYGEYCSNLPKAQDMIDELCTKNELINQSVIRCQQEANDGKFKLRDLLSLPMQRILKYHLLLNELLKYTTEAHDDLEGLQKAYDAMVDLGQYINEVKRDSETLQIIGDIQESITDLDMPENTELKDYGRLLKDGEIKLKSQEDSKQKSRYIFVFDKVMLMCKSIRGEQYSYKEALILADYQVEDNPSLASNLNKYKCTHSWFLVHRQDKTIYTFYTKTEEMKRKWIDAIEKAHNNVCPEGNGLTDHSFTMFSFEKATTCGACDKLLKGMFFQGYKCTVCAVGVHKQCIPFVRSCGAPQLPPRPPLPPSSPSIVSTHSGEEDNFRNSWNDEKRLNGHSVCLDRVKALSSFEGDRSLRQISFTVDDMIQVTNRQVKDGDGDEAGEGETFWEGRVERTGDEGLFPSNLVEEIQDPNRLSYEDPNFPFVPNANNGLHADEGYVNLNLEEHQWFAGPMPRGNAQTVLDKLPNGTFLVRISEKQRGGYAISLNYNGHVKHMRVCSTEDGHFYLSQSKYFKSIVELVKWYEDHSLAESFNGLNIVLATPYKKVLASMEPIGTATAMYSFTGNSSNLLSLRKGERVSILSKAGEEKGWWKGQIEERIGYFPLAYVSELKEE